MANSASLVDLHQTCKNIQYRKDLRIEELEAENTKLLQSNEEKQTIYTNLYREHQKLLQQLRDCGEHNKQTTQHADRSYEKYKLYKAKYTECRQAIRVWQQYYDNCKSSRADRAQGRQEHVISTEITSHAPHTESNPHENVILSAAPPTPVRLTDLDVSINLPSLSPPRAGPGLPGYQVGSVQSTADGSESTECPSSPPLKVELSSDDAPVVVSARPVKRKRSASERAMPPPVRIKHEPKSPNQEYESESALYAGGTLSGWTLPRHQTSDLDALADKLATPRKPKSIRRSFSKQSPQSQSVVASSVDHKDGNFKNVKAESDESETREHASFAGRKSYGARDSNSVKGQVLRNLDVNANYKRTELRPRPGKVTNRPFDGTADKIHMLSEDGEGDFRKDIHPGIDDGSSQQLRLNSILDLPTPNNRVLKRTPPLETSAHSVKKNTPSRDMKSVVPQSVPAKLKKFPIPFSSVNSRRSPVKPASSTHGSRPQKEGSSGSLQPERLQRPHGLEISPPPPAPDDEPLRLRPAATLRLEDFCINPKYMDSEYAWADTLRGRDQRRCLPGCTKPDCCGGAFMSFANMGSASWSHQNDEVALEAHLGLEWATIMGARSPDERAQMLNQARAASLANQFGKHRQAFERRSTPPGFWRTDMPSTQEAEEDRMKAREMVREKIEERRREAMREGGRWLFRDE